MAHSAQLSSQGRYVLFLDSSYKQASVRRGDIVLIFLVVPPSAKRSSNQAVVMSRLEELPVSRWCW